MKILLTGATGFIGANLWRVLLERGHDVMGVSRQPPAGNERESMVSHVCHVMGESLPDSVVSFSPEVLVHLAWDGIPDFSAKICADNVAAQVKFLGETEKLNSLKKILVSGSCREYGDNKGLCQEAETLAPDSYFSWAKQTLSDYFRLACQQRNINLLWFRLFYVYGPGQRSASLIPSLLQSVRDGLEPEIKNPSSAHDFIYIDDVVDAFVKGIEDKKSSGILNLGSGRIVSVFEVVEIVMDLLRGDTSPSRKRIRSLGEETLKSGLIASISQSKLVLAWTPKTGLSEGIEKTWKLSS